MNYQTLISNQEVLIETLKNNAVAYDGYATEWPAQHGYIATTEYTNPVGGNESDGIDYVVLDDDNVAMRLSGDSRDDGEWEIVYSENFWDRVIEDAKDILEILRQVSKPPERITK